MIISYTVKSLGEYFSCIGQITRNYITQNEKSEPWLWFRGHEQYNYSIIPTLFRGKCSEVICNNYTQTNFREAQRINHFGARNHHFVESNLTNNLDWMEVMQHHSTSTRLADWSTSSIHALLFALDPYMDSSKSKYVCKDGYVISPHVYVSMPQMINKKIIELILNSKEKILERCLKYLQVDDKYHKEIVALIHKNGEMYTDIGDSYETKMNFLYNLPMIIQQIESEPLNFVEQLRNGDQNPWHYIFYAIYYRGMKLSLYELPPLSILTYVHSQRIKDQHGAFSIFPNYINHTGKLQLNQAGMEYNDSIQEYMFRIEIESPKDILEEIRANGFTRSWIYSEAPIISYEIEGF